MPNNRRSDVLRELAELAGHDRPTAQQHSRFYELEAEIADLDHAERTAQLSKIRDTAAGAGGGRVEAGSPGPDSPYCGESPRSGVRTTAEKTIAGASRSAGLSDDAAERATALIESGSLRDRTSAAEWITRTGDADYLSAFMKVCSDPQRGHLTWTEQERVAFSRVQEYRAMSLTDISGGYMVPLMLDPAIMLTSGGSASTLRQNCRVVTIATDEWHGISSAGVTAKWHAEAEEVDDDSPELAEPGVPVHRGDAFIPFSFEVGMDALNFVAEMQRLLVDGADQLMATAYTTGSGTGQPTGIVTALAGGSSVVTSGGTEAFVSGDIYKMQAALPPRFSANARWMANIATINQAAQFESAAGARLFPEVGSGQLLRKPLDELSTMDSVINPAATEANHILLYGDFAAGMVIVDRIGTTVELVPHLMGSNRRPTGQRGLLMWFRTGSDVVVDNAFRLLNVGTTA